MYWWNTNYRFRRQLIISAGSRVIPNPFLALLPDISGIGTMLANRDDVRILRWTDTSWQELDRIRFADNRVYIPINDEVPVNSYTDRYWIYYNYPSAGAAPAEIRNIFLPRIDTQTNSLYYLTQDGGDYGDGILTPDTDLTSNANVSFPDFGFYKAAYGNGSNAALFRASASPQDSWGTGTHPLRNFEFWLYPVGYAYGKVLAFWRAGGPGSWQKINVGVNGGTLFIEYNRIDASGSLVALTFNDIIIASELHHYAAAWFQGAFNGIGGVTVYRDGAAIASQPAPAYPIVNAQNAFPSLFSYFNGVSMEAFLNAYLFGVRLGRDNGDELNARYAGKPFNWGRRNILPTVEILGAEGLSAHMGAV